MHDVTPLIHGRAISGILVDLDGVVYVGGALLSVRSKRSRRFGPPGFRSNYHQDDAPPAAPDHAGRLLPITQLPRVHRSI
jgi:hypothetical protein